MATPVRESVLAAVKTALEGIDGTGSYYHTVKKVYRWSANPLNEHELPAIFMHERGEIYEPGPVQTQARHLTILLEAWLESEALSTDIAKLVADIERALAADHTLGGKSVDVILRTNEAFANSEREPRGGIVVEVEVFYRTPFSNPDQATP